MAGMIGNKRKVTKELKHPIDSKVRKSDNISSLSKQAIMSKFKELEEENGRLKSINKSLTEKNNELNQRIANKDEELSNAFSKSVTISHINTQTEDLLDEAQYPCAICIYVADCPEELCCHMGNAHGLGDLEFTNRYSCKICRKSFAVKDELMYHLKKSHERNVPFCKYYQIGICNFSDEQCWFIHKKDDKAMKIFKCGYCGHDFKSKSDFMIHRKKDHSASVKACINFENGICEFKEKCWYHHNNVSENSLSFSEY